ncbi:MAG TPA: DUF3426 domain-containing protein [Chiayiivirga sp.]|nr:DUF3426 domain-containing protein [Chiayiivirga sp.]
MFTRCNHCLTTTPVTAAQLALTHGVMRCLQCGQQFDPWANLQRESTADNIAAIPTTTPSDTFEQTSLDLDFVQPIAPDVAPASDVTVDVIDLIKADEPLTALAVAPLANAGIVVSSDALDPAPHLIAPTPAQDDVAALIDAPSPVVDVPAQDLEHAAHAIDAAPVPASTKAVIPSFARAPVGAATHATVENITAPRFVPSPVTTCEEAPARDRSWPRWLTVLALAILLLAQSFFAERERLAASPQWRPWLSTLCAGLGCSLPAWHEPAALHVLSRDVRPHPSVADALLISASFRNDAAWAQAWPALQLTLSNLDGQTIAKRRFAPSEYLGLSLPGQRIEPGQTASISLEVRDPGKQAVAFEFEFL